MFIFANELHYIFQVTDLNFTKYSDYIENYSKNDEKRMSFSHANSKFVQQNLNE